MPFVKATCTNCGGNLEVDSSKEAAICPFCGTAYIVEKAIQKYNIESVHANTVNIISSEQDKEQLLKNAETLKKLGKPKEAYKTYLDIVKKYPDDSNACMK